MHSSSGQQPSKLRAWLIISTALFVLAMALTVPWLFPTETLWYKAGSKRLMLLSAQLSGLFTLVLLLVQILLGLRPSWLVRSFSSVLLLRLHRLNGGVLVAGALSHVLLVLLPEGLANLPLGWKFWPELMGVASLFWLLVTVVLSWGRASLRLAYGPWRLVHRLIAALLPALLMVHVLFVSESFAGGLPRMALLIGVVLLYLAAALVWIDRGRTHSTTNTPRRSL